MCAAMMGSWWWQEAPPSSKFHIHKHTQTAHVHCYLTKRRACAEINYCLVAHLRCISRVCVCTINHTMNMSRNVTAHRALRPMIDCWVSLCVVVTVCMYLRIFCYANVHFLLTWTLRNCPLSEYSYSERVIVSALCNYGVHKALC